MRGPYTRFVVHYPRTWHTKSAPDSDVLHLEPVERDLDLSVTFTVAAISVAGPQGLLDAMEVLAESRGLDWIRSRARIDRWGSDAWAASWAWEEKSDNGSVRPWQVFAIGHDQGLVLATITGELRIVEEQYREIEEIIASLTLPPSDLLAPEQFPAALCELLNDRRSHVDSYWTFAEDGSLVSRGLQVRLWDLYRAYLLDGDLEELALALDARERNDIETMWAGSTWEDVQERLRVVLRREENVGELPIVQVPIAGGLVACPVLDSEDRMTFIPIRESERWGMDPLDLLTRAVAALDTAGPVQFLELQDTQGESLNGVLLAEDDGYDSGRLLCPRIRDLLSEILGGPLIAAMPAAGLVFVARDDDFARKQLQEAAEHAFERRPRPLSRCIWSWTEVGLEPLSD